MEALNTFFETLSGYLWGWPMIILLLGTHIFLTFRLGVPQRKLLTAIKLSISKDKGSTGDVSQFGALATALAATIGTGNIVGVATAVALGGPGAVLWCWLSGVFGMATKYGEGLLAIKYRIKTEDGRMLGGPMYGSITIPINVLINDTASAPASCTESAISAIEVTLGESFTINVLS